VQNEGDIGVGTRPYEISYGSLVPKKAQCENLLVPICVSSSHIAFGSIRMEPVFMILGQSAATAACMSIDEGIAVQDLSYDKLKERLEADGQVLQYAGGGGSHGGPRGLSSKKLAGVVIDESKAKLVGKWAPSTSQGPFVDAGYHHDHDTNKGAMSATYTAKLKPGRYDVRVIYSPNNNRATNVPVTVKHAGGEKTVRINQRKAPSIDKTSVSVGAYDFDGAATVIIANDGTDGHVIIDAVQFVPAK